MGDSVKKFEQELNFFFNRPTICVANGTSALQLALQAVGVCSGDEVLVPSLTYIASFQAISSLGAIPVPCDVLDETLTLDPDDVLRKITAKTKVIMPVHYAGGVGKLSKIFELSKKFQLRVIEDAAHAFGSTYGGKKVGSFGDIACFSFDGIKNITCGEGGCIVTSDDLVIKKVSDARLLGVEKDTENRFLGKRSWDFDVNAQGWRFHMSNIMAAIGRIQLKRFPEFAVKRQRLAQIYDKQLSGNPFIKLIPQDYSSVVPHIYPIRLLGDVNRERIREALQVLDIETGIHYKPNHLLSFYKGGEISCLPNTEYIYPQLLSLPLHPEIKDEQVLFICKSLLKILNSNSDASN